MSSSATAMDQKLIEEIRSDNQLLAIIVSSRFQNPGVTFFTPDSFYLQLGSMCHPAGKQIAPHSHGSSKREVLSTQEVLVIKKGKIRVDFYTDSKDYLMSRILGPGDIILLSAGGHGFEVLEELEMIEVKQGPYVADTDKTRFKPLDPKHVRYHCE